MAQNDDPQGTVHTEGVKPPDRTNTAKPPATRKPSAIESDDADTGEIQDRTIERTPGPHG